ncbi:MULTISPECIES: 4'-phosphopantetheinyl transferase family protein [unclassified Enterobacter]|uniref:4'-phosphopantetheinyl transferase family protein n=1 Tax=unclassified Enterobacter TaxID=2608935 RepID=UPI0008E703B6|nr:MULTISPECIES: hypothetical protein [unclassified Enterobacter]SFR12369.1 Phosphopantetheinyl transferase [Enterobacter sp. kpr-6]
MATHFARGILTEGHLMSIRLPSSCHEAARQLPEHQRNRFLASRSLLAELMFMLYGISELPEIIVRAEGRPVFADAHLPSFSLSYAGNLVGVTVTTEGVCGLDMELQRATRGFLSPHAQERHTFASSEKLWINNQTDPNEAQAQIITLRQSVLKMANQMQDTSGFLQLFPGSGRLRTAQSAPTEVVCDAEDVLIWSVAVTPAIESLNIWSFDSKEGWHRLPAIQPRANKPAARLMRFSSLSA